MKLGSVSGIIAAIAAALLPPAATRAAAENLPVAAMTIYPGQAISEDMLTEQAFTDGTSAAYPVVATAGEIVGKVARRTLLPGKLIARVAVGEPDIVGRGTIVRAVLSTGGLQMRTAVVALQAGGLGAVIQVRNVDSGKVITGVVQADGTVRVGAP
jgi:flagella basal body P-ring formation protein FlgA